MTTTDELKRQLEADLPKRPEPAKPATPDDFYIVLADDHVDRLTAKAYDFKRYTADEAHRIAKGMAKRNGVSMFVMKAVSVFAPVTTDG